MGTIATPVSLPPEVQAIMAAIAHLSLNVDCPPVTALLTLIKDVRDTMDPELRKSLDAIQVDWNLRWYWGVIVPVLRDIGLKDPPAAVSAPGAK